MMREYIEREAAVAEIRKGTVVTDDAFGMGVMRGMHIALERIAALPAADAVEVRCKDCKHYHLFEDGVMDCRHSGGLNEAYPDDFCSYGEKRED